MKKILSVFLSVLMLTSVVAAVDLSAYAATSGDYSYTVLDDGTVEIDKYNGSASTLTIPSSIDGYTVTRIDSFAFEDCTSLINVTIPDSVTSIGIYAFEECTNLANINIPDGVTDIGEKTFYYCKSLTSITIPDSVTSIGKRAFAACYSLTSITIGYGVTSIDDSAFSVCSSLTSITVDSNNSYYASSDGVLFNKDKTELVRYPEGKSGSSYTIPNSVTSIGNSSFYNCTGLTSITIPNSVINIDEYAFEGCTGLTSITIPNSVTSIGYNAFSGCSDLASVTIPDSVTNLGDDAFSSCFDLTRVTLGNSVIEIGSSTFYACESLTIVIIPESVTKIGNMAFYECDMLTDVYYGGSENGWNKIDIGEDNKCLTNATIHFAKCTTHTWDSGKTTKTATCSATGVKTYTCTVCGETKTETIAKKSHSWEVKTKGSATNKKSGTYKCKNCGTTKKLYYPKTMSLSTSSYTYNGKAKKPTVTIKDSNGSKISSKYYKVTYINQSTGKTVSSMKNPGKYYVKVTFKTRYSGSLQKAVTIKPKKTSIKSVKASSKGFTVKWSKVSTQNTGYQVQYSTSKSFKSAKTVTISKTGTTSKKVTKLKAKKKYYVRVRTYKTVKINGKNTKIYSSWSSVKGVTTKK